MISVSGQMSEVSGAFRRGDLVGSGPDGLQVFQGYKECKRMMDTGVIKEGRVICIIRSFEYSYFRDIMGKHGKKALRDLVV